MSDGAPYIHRGLKPPTQHLVGSGFTLDLNPDTAPLMRGTRLKRRARRLLSGGVITGRVEEVWYEVQKDGLVTRVDESGERKVVPDGHFEHRWVCDAHRWLHARTTKGRKAAGDPPPDLVDWEIAARLNQPPDEEEE